ncbi:MAG: hypothetical protein OXT09_30870 [Myxococcales bacterium]|nr:hypothetical protein [Myxococcales bacterium]
MVDEPQQEHDWCGALQELVQKRFGFDIRALLDWLSEHAAPPLATNWNPGDELRARLPRDEGNTWRLHRHPTDVAPDALPKETAAWYAVLHCWAYAGLPIEPIVREMADHLGELRRQLTSLRSGYVKVAQRYWTWVDGSGEARAFHRFRPDSRFDGPDEVDALMQEVIDEVELLRSHIDAEQMPEPDALQTTLMVILSRGEFSHAHIGELVGLAEPDRERRAELVRDRLRKLPKAPAPS